MAKTKKISAKEFDKRAAAGEDVSEHFDFNAGTKRFNLDMPIWALRELDAEANRQGVTRQSLVKIWLIERLDAIKLERGAKKIAAV